MALVLFVLFLVVPIAELAVVVTIGQEIGIPETILLMIGMSAAGAFMAKRQGLRVVGAIRDRLHQGDMPGTELIDGLLILIAAALLLTPGFLTDVLALLLLVPPVRVGIRRIVRRSFERRVQFVRVARFGHGLDADAREFPP